MSLIHEGPETQPLDTQADEFQRLVEPLAPPAAPEAPKRWPLLVVATVIVAVVIVGGVWWLLSSTVSQNDYDEVVGELTATELALEESEQALSGSDAALSSAQQWLEETERALAIAENDVASAEADLSDAVETVAAYEEGTIAFWALVLEQGVGFDVEDADCIATEIVSSGGPETMAVFSEFALSGADAVPPLTFMGGVFDAMGACGVAGPDVPPTASEAEPQALRDECATGSGAACDALYFSSPLGSDDELFGATCGGRYTLDEAPPLCEGAIGT